MADSRRFSGKNMRDTFKATYGRVKGAGKDANSCQSVS